jgi:rSAM/selenodomain-associated transferase 1
MAERQLIIFARPARLGAVKSRLAKDIGVLAAWRFYRHTLAELIAEVGGDQRWQTTLSVSRGAVRWPGGLARAAQGRGDLGARMLAAMRAQAPGPVVLIGSDIPSVRRHHIAAAFALLGRHHAVFGPANDGGFWLVGLRHPARYPRLFDNVRWSGSSTLADTLANVDDYGLVETLVDVDTAADLELIRSDPSPAGVE